MTAPAQQQPTPRLPRCCARGDRQYNALHNPCPACVRAIDAEQDRRDEDS